MKKKIALGLIALVAVAGGVAAMSAYEAHVINVTAKIENALNVHPKPIEFGTVFPQEYLTRQLTVAMSESFSLAEDADDVVYVIKQKPKCADSLESPIVFSRVIEVGGVFVCENPDHFMLPVLCPFLSKHDADPSDLNDGPDIDAFHGSLDWTVADTEGNVVDGYLAKSADDEIDLWTIDLAVPCFEGMCAQDWEHQGWELDPADESKIFGCDLWVEVTRISRYPEPQP